MHHFYPQLRWPIYPVRPPNRIIVAPQTGPLDLIQARRILVVADSQNLVCGCRDIGLKLSWRLLGDLLRATVDRAYLHTCFARSDPKDCTHWDYFIARGWTPHVKNARSINRPDGRVERDANVDNLVAFVSGRLASRLSVDVVLVGTGDGTLCQDVAEALATLPSGPAVASLSVAGSTARRLDARISGSLLAANVEIGLDAMRAMTVNPSVPV